MTTDLPNEAGQLVEVLDDPVVRPVVELDVVDRPGPARLPSYGQPPLYYPSLNLNLRLQCNL